MEIVIDRSGSMQSTQGGSGGAANLPKIELAKEAAFQAVSQLNSRDSVGVITFDTRQHTERSSRTAKRANTTRRLRLVRGGRAS